MRHLLCAVLLLLTVCSVALALPSFRGYTGLMLVPTADALNRGEFNGGIFFEDVASGVINNYAFNYGVAHGVEFGVDRYQFDDDAEPQTLVNAKYRFMPETDAHPCVAGGIIDFTDQLETSVYIVASKSINPPMCCHHGEVLNPRVHIGIGGGRLSSVFVGFSTYLGTWLQVMGEWDSKNVQLGAKIRITPSVTAHAAFFDVFDHGTFGVGVSFDKFY